MARKVKKCCIVSGRQKLALSLATSTGYAAMPEQLPETEDKNLDLLRQLWDSSSNLFPIAGALMVP